MELICNCGKGYNLDDALAVFCSCGEIIRRYPLLNNKPSKINLIQMSVLLSEKNAAKVNVIEIIIITLIVGFILFLTRLAILNF